MLVKQMIASDIAWLLYQAKWSRETPLTLASKYGREAVVREILKAAARGGRMAVDINARNDEGCTALHFACSWGYEGIVHMLIEQGADVNLQDNGGWTPLHYACLEGRKRVVQMLLEATPSLDEGAVDVNKQTNEGETPLWMACYSNHFAIAQLLLDNGAEPDTPHVRGRNALTMEFSEKPREEAVPVSSALLRGGASPDLFDGELTWVPPPPQAQQEESVIDNIALRGFDNTESGTVFIQ